jgi:hypothetical protein
MHLLIKQAKQKSLKMWCCEMQNDKITSDMYCVLHKKWIHLFNKICDEYNCY